MEAVIAQNMDNMAAQLAATQQLVQASTNLMLSAQGRSAGLSQPQSSQFSSAPHLVPGLLAAPAAMDSISGFPTHQASLGFSTEAQMGFHDLGAYAQSFMGSHAFQPQKQMEFAGAEGPAPAPTIARSSTAMFSPLGVSSGGSDGYGEDDSW